MLFRSIRYLQLHTVTILLTICIIVLVPAQPSYAAGPYTCSDIVRIMPTGDSITQGHASGVANIANQISYRKTLYDSLIAQGRQIDFVGSNSAGWNYAGFDADHMGYPGWQVDQVEAEIYSWLVQNNPNIVLLHIGTNEVNPAFVSNLENLLNEVDRYESDYSLDVTVIVARIIRRVNSKPLNTETTQYNNGLASLVNTRITNGDDLILVDMENSAGIIYEYQANGGDFVDTDSNGIHPVASGYDKMAAIWEAALLPILPDCSGQSGNTPPVSEAGQNWIYGDINNNGSETITLDGTASYDPDGTITTYNWYKNGNLVATGATPNVSLSLGVNNFALEVTDDDGAKTTDVVSYKLVAGSGPTGLIALYEFAEGSGLTVTDTSGYLSPLNLTIQNIQNTTWFNGFLEVDKINDNTSNYTRITSGTAATKINDAIAYSGALTVEAWIAPENMTQNGPARVMTISPTPLLRNLTIGTGTGGTSNSETYSVRLQTSDYATGQYAFYYSANGAVRQYLTHLVVTFDDATNTLNIFIDGVLYRSATINGNLQNWQTSYPLTITNELTENRQWLGQWHRLAIYNRAMPETEIDSHYAAGPGNGSAYLIESNQVTLVAEGGITDSYTVAPATAPSGNITITALPDANCDLGNGAGNPLNLAFTSGNWTTARNVIVTATNDTVIEGNHSCIISHSVTSSTAANYPIGTPLGVIIGTITDNDPETQTPTNLVASNVTRTGLSLTWTDPNNIETAYLLERSVNGSSWAQIANLPANTTNYNDTSVSCGNNYGYRVRAYFSTIPAYSNYATTNTSTPACLPTPSVPTLNSVSEATIALNLPSNPNNYTLQIQRQDQAQLLTTMAGSGNWATIAEVTNTNTNYVDSPLTCETLYSYRYRWLDGPDSSQWGSELTIGTNPCPAPLTHSFGLYKDGQWSFYTIDGNNAYDARFTFGPTDGQWQAIIGDWDGDGIDGIGIYSEGVWTLRSATPSGVTEITLTFGPAETGWTPLLGDWDGNGTDTVGLYKTGVFLLRNSNTTGTADITANFGTVNSIPVVGDWNSDNVDSIGYYDNGTFTLSNTNVAPQASIVSTFGPSGWQPLVGDWNDDNKDTVGVFNNGLWRMSNSNTSGEVNFGFNYGNLSGGWQPLGNFDSDPSILNLLFASTVPMPRIPVIPGPSVIVTPSASSSSVGNINEVPSTDGTAIETSPTPEAPITSDAPDTTSTPESTEDS